MGEKLPNAWGLYDMHGNVQEWCQDFYGRYSNETQKMVSDPEGPALGKRRGLRGGAFGNFSVDVRAAYRFVNYFPPDLRSYAHGFRLARTYDLSP